MAVDSATAATVSAAMGRTAVTSEPDGGTVSVGRGLDDKTRLKSRDPCIGPGSAKDTLHGFRQNATTTRTSR